MSALRRGADHAQDQRVAARFSTVRKVCTFKVRCRSTWVTIHKGDSHSGIGAKTCTRSGCFSASQIGIKPKPSPARTAALVAEGSLTR